MTTTYEEDDGQLLTPREAAARLGIAVRTLAQWERRGWLAPTRLPNGYRRYTQRDVTAAIDARGKSA